MKCLTIASLMVTVAIASFSLMMETGDAEINIRSAVVALSFDEGEGKRSVDLSRNGNIATLKGGATWGKGKFGGGIVLDGEDGYVEVPNANDAWAFGDDDFTIAAYVLMDQRGKDRRYNIMGYTSALLDAVFWDGWWFRLRHCCAGEQLYFHFCIGCGGGGGGGTDMGPQVPGRYKYMEWHHYAMGRSGNKMRMFYDGKLIGEKDWTTSIKAGNAKGAPLNIGRTAKPRDEHYLDGMVDDVAVFKVALSEEDLQQLTEEGLADALAVSTPGKLVTTWAHIKKPR